MHVVFQIRVSDDLLCDSLSFDVGGLPPAPKLPGPPLPSMLGLDCHSKSPVSLADAALAICAAAVCAACAVSAVKSAAAAHTGWAGTLGSDGTSGEGGVDGRCGGGCSDGGSWSGGETATGADRRADGLFLASGFWLVAVDAAVGGRPVCRRVGTAQLRLGSSRPPFGELADGLTDLARSSIWS